MPSPSKRVRIGYYGFTQEERTPRLLAGILERRREEKGIELYQFLIDQLKTFDNDVFPPWTGKVDGVLIGLAIAGPVDEVIGWVGNAGVPAVTMVSNIIDPRYPIVIVDPESPVRLVARELIRCRCRRFVFVGFRPSVGSSLRGQALERAAKTHGLPFSRLDSEWSFNEDFGEDPAENQELAAMLTAGPRPVGVHALNDAIGRRVLRICHEQGLGVPEDVAIVTEDDTPLAFEQQPTLTSVCNPGEQVGYRAAGLLAEIIGGRRPPTKPVLVPANKLVRRESTGGPREEDCVVRALEIIRRRAMRGLQVQDLVASLGVNRRTFERAFRERLGRSPAFEIQRYRMAAARELLNETEFPIGQIGALVGYAEQAAFTNAFRRESGFSPKDFRRQPRLGGGRRKSGKE